MDLGFRGGQLGERTAKGHETSGADGHVHYFGCGDFTSTYHMSKFIKLYLLNMCSSLYVSSTSTKLFKKKNRVVQLETNSILNISPSFLKNTFLYLACSN